MKQLIECAWQKAAAELAAEFDVEVGLVGEEAPEINYHSAISGGRVHRTVKNIQYAIVLLRRGTPEDSALAIDIIQRVLAEQDTCAEHETFGIWPYLFEEPLSEMKNPDWNWAGFIGTMLVTILNEWHDVLPQPLCAQMEQALSNACHSVLRRNMGLDYTNISLMMAGLLVCSGEIVGNDAFVEKGYDNFSRQLEFVQKNGGYAEYNSPNYGIIDLEETGRVLYYCKSDKVRAVVAQLHAEAWRVLAEHYHFPTKQLAPPHCRTYVDLQDNRIPSLFRIGTNDAISCVSDQDFMMLIPWLYITLDCPKELQEIFYQPAEEKVVCYPFYQGFDLNTPEEVRVLIEKNAPMQTGYTYLNPTYCLGTFAQHDLWNQRRPLMGYFTTPAGTACLRVRCMHDNMDFASSVSTCVQEKNAVAGAVSFVKDHGDYHYILTPLDNGTFTADCFSVEFTVSGAQSEVRIEQREAQVFDFYIGAHIVRLQLVECLFDGAAVQPVLFQNDEVQGIRLPLVKGEQAKVDLNACKESYIVYHLEVLQQEMPATSAAIVTGDLPNSAKLVLNANETEKESASFSRVPGNYIAKIEEGMEKCFKKGGFYYVKAER